MQGTEHEKPLVPNMSLRYWWKGKMYSQMFVSACNLGISCFSDLSIFRLEVFSNLHAVTIDQGSNWIDLESLIPRAITYPLRVLLVNIQAVDKLTVMTSLEDG